MDELVEHLKPENMQRLIDLYPNPFGEVKRLLYRIMRSAVSDGADSMRLIPMPDRIETSRKGNLLKSYELTFPVENQTELFRSKLIQILERDQVVTRYVQVTKQTPEELEVAIGSLN